ncbi:MAG: hypothetical protein Q9207_005242 [Kuettlingeria erythrocarpa]
MCNQRLAPLLFTLASGLVRTYASPCQPRNSSSDSPDRIIGWVSQPNDRGSIDIIWTCLFTIFVCTYTVLCLNVPSEDESNFDVIYRRVFWMAIAIIGPEFVLTYASGQWGTARESVRLFHGAGYEEWSLRHGFFADMGGFVLIPAHASGRGEGRPFRITAKHLHYLVQKKYLEYPTVTQKELWDKSKQDTVTKVITCFQIGYLVLQCLGRAGQGLEITTLELSTLAIVVCTILTSICWLRKPLDVRTPITLRMETSIERVLCDAGEAAAIPFRQTPLDFVDDLGPSWSLNVQTFMKMPTMPYERPITRFGNDRFPNLKGYQEAFLCFSTLVYAAIHLAGWNFAFPTKLEQVLWRVSSMFLFGNTALFWICETTSSWYRNGRWQRLFYRAFDPSKMEDIEKARLEKQDQRIRKELPLKWEFWSIFPLAVTYGAARGYLIVEVFLGLRSLQPSAYVNVNWSAIIPHV